MRNTPVHVGDRPHLPLRSRRDPGRRGLRALDAGVHAEQGRARDQVRPLAGPHGRFSARRSMWIRHDCAGRYAYAAYSSVTDGTSRMPEKTSGTARALLPVTMTKAAGPPAKPRVPDLAGDYDGRLVAVHAGGVLDYVAAHEQRRLFQELGQRHARRARRVGAGAQAVRPSDSAMSPCRWSIRPRFRTCAGPCASPLIDGESATTIVPHPQHHALGRGRLVPFRQKLYARPTGSRRSRTGGTRPYRAT